MATDFPRAVKPAHSSFIESTDPCKEPAMEKAHPPSLPASRAGVIARMPTGKRGVSRVFADLDITGQAPHGRLKSSGIDARHGQPGERHDGARGTAAAPARSEA